MSDNNIPAFPLFKTFPGDDGDMVTLVQSGMTMRQWYKGMALIGILHYSTGLDIDHALKRMAENCGAVADAMLAEDASFAARSK